MNFRSALLHITKQVLTAHLRLGQVYLSKVDFVDSYMRLWVRMEEVQSVTFLTPKNTHRKTQLVGFHLTLPMGYINSPPYVCMATETVVGLTN